MQRCAFTPYEGHKPYIFVSYAHKDSDRVFPVLEELDRRGYRVWYDDGIAPGSEWPENIAQHLDGCSLTLAFISPASIASANCRREVTFALSKKKPFLGILLEKTEMSLGMEMQLSAQQCIMKYTYASEDAFYNKVCSCPDLKPCLGQPKVVPATAAETAKPVESARPKMSAKPVDKKLVGIIAGTAAALVLLVVLIAVFAGGGENADSTSGSAAETGSTTAASQGTTQSTAPAEDYYETVLYYSDQTVTAADAEYISKHTQLQYLSFENCAIEENAFDALVLPKTMLAFEMENCSGQPNLSALSGLDALQELQLVNASVLDQSVPEISSQALTSLNISGNPQFADLTKFAGAVHIQELDFSNTGVSDLGVLANMKELTHINGSNTAVSDLTPLTGLKELLSLRFAKCSIDTIGASFECLYLSEVDLSENKLEELTVFEYCTVLTRADFSYNNLSFVSVLSKNAESLQWLSLSGNTSLYNTNVQFIADCTNLSELYLDGVKLFDLGILENLHLSKLSANECYLSNIEGLKHLENMQHLSLALNSLSDISVLAGLPDYVSLDLSFNNGLRDVSALNTDIYYQYLNLTSPNLDASTLPVISGSTLITAALPAMLEPAFPAGNFSNYAVLACPLDKVVAYENKFGKGSVIFVDEDAQYIVLLQEYGFDHRYLLEKE